MAAWEANATEDVQGCVTIIRLDLVNPHDLLHGISLAIFRPAAQVCHNDTQHDSAIIVMSDQRWREFVFLLSGLGSA